MLAAPSRQLLFWVPPWHRLGLFWPRNTVVIAQGAAQLGLDNFTHGLDWERCQN